MLRRFRTSRLAICAFASLGALPDSLASSHDRRTDAEAFLVRAWLERGAFHACAGLQPQGGDLQAVLARGWEQDLQDLSEALRAAGHSALFIAALPGRFTLDAAAPHFPKRAELERFCVSLGDWQARLYWLQFSMPQLELQRLIEQEQVDPE